MGHKKVLRFPEMPVMEVPKQLITTTKAEQITKIHRRSATFSNGNESILIFQAYESLLRDEISDKDLDVRTVVSLPNSTFPSSIDSCQVCHPGFS